jgi:hypothetical protein
MKGTVDLIAKWTEQKAELQAEADRMSPGTDRDSVLQRIALCQRAIEAAELLLPARTRVAASPGPSKPCQRDHPIG